MSVCVLAHRFDPVLHRKSRPLLDVRFDVSDLFPRLVLALMRLDLMEGYVDVLGHRVLLLEELVNEVSFSLLTLGDRLLSLDCLHQPLLAFVVLSVPPQVGGLQGEGWRSHGLNLHF